MVFLFSVHEILFFTFDRQIQDLERIGQNSVFDLLIEWAVGLETWRLVHFYQPRLGQAVDKDIKTQDLETQVGLGILRLRGSVRVRHRLVTSDYRLDC